MAERNTLVVRKRIAGIFFGALGVFFCLFCRIFIVQVISADQYQQKALNQRMRPVMIDAKRGTIYDRNGKKLAISVNTDTLYAVPRNRKPQRTCQAVGANYRFGRGKSSKN